jgi:hypothetical protein
VTPLLSVLIPSYNRPEFVGAAVASVLSSDYDDYEVIVSDDCSPRLAEIEAVLARYAAHPRFRFYAQPRNLREPGNRRFLLDSAVGDWQLFLSDDDKLYPQALRTIAQAIATNPGVDLFTFGYTLIDECDRSRYSRHAPVAIRVHRDDARLLRQFLYSEAFPYWFYQPATFCCHRRVRSRISPNPNIGMGDDLQFLFDYVNDGGTMLVIPEVLMCYRKIDARATHLQLNQSGARLANTYTRYRMMVDFGRRADLCPQFRRIVDTLQFRQHFVYVAAVSERMEPQTLAREIGMEDQHARELLAFGTGKVRQILRLRGYIERSGFFLRLFGLRGVAEIVRVASERTRSRLMPRAASASSSPVL